MFILNKLLISVRNMQWGTKLCMLLSVGRGAQAWAESRWADGSLVVASETGHTRSLQGAGENRARPPRRAAPGSGGISGVSRSRKTPGKQMGSESARRHTLTWREFMERSAGSSSSGLAVCWESEGQGRLGERERFVWQHWLWSEMSTVYIFQNDLSGGNQVP